MNAFLFTFVTEMYWLYDGVDRKDLCVFLKKCIDLD